jgi:hypothetical protein
MGVIDGFKGVAQLTKPEALTECAPHEKRLPASVHLTKSSTNILKILLIRLYSSYSRVSPGWRTPTMKRIMTTLLFMAGILAVATASHAPAAANQGGVTLRAECCDPFPVCPPFCDPPPPPDGGFAR